MFNTLQFLSAKWKVLAIQLHIQKHTIEAIQKNNPGDVDVCLIEMLGHWLELNYDYHQYGKPSWRIVAKNVQRMNPGLFEEIARDHPTGKSNMTVVLLAIISFSCSSKSHDKTKD